MDDTYYVTSVLNELENITAKGQMASGDIWASVDALVIISSARTTLPSAIISAEEVQVTDPILIVTIVINLMTISVTLQSCCQQLNVKMH